MSQSRRASLAEACMNMVSGYIVSFIVGQLCYPLFGITVSAQQNLLLVAIFTVTSLIRSYAWRRAFNWWQHRKEA